MSEWKGNDVVLGKLVGRKKRPVMLGADDRSMHMAVFGSTGTGKSKFFESLIRQDIEKWKDSGCGLIMFDHHGSIYKELIRWMAQDWNHWKIFDVPILPVDLTNEDMVVGYDVLRLREEVSSEVVINQAITALGHVWGVDDFQATPTLARLLPKMFHSIYETELGVGALPHLLDPQDPRLRREILEVIKDDATRREFASLLSMSQRDFGNEILSVRNRANIFNGSLLKTMSGMPGVSLDFGKALEEGWIILVNLSTEGGKVPKQDSKALATLMLSDLWLAAESRGKDANKKPKPFYVYIDEFQNYVSPALGESFDQARGFGLHLNIACQFPNQILDAGDHGEKLYNSVMENARTKVSFQLQDPRNLKMVAEDLFSGTFDPDEVKHILHSTKVLDYKREYLRAYSESSSQSESYTEGFSEGQTESTSSGQGESSDMEDGEFNLSDLFVDTLNTRESTNEGSSEGRSSTYTNSSSTSQSSTKSETFSESLIPILGKELSSIQYRSIEEQLQRSMAVLNDQKQRQFVVRFSGGGNPYSVLTPFVESANPIDEMIDEFLKNCRARFNFVLTREEANEKVEQNILRLNSIATSGFSSSEKGMIIEITPSGYEEPDDYMAKS